MKSFVAFQANIALALQYIALVSGVLLLNKARGEGFFCKKTGQIVGGFVAIAAILSILCTFYFTIRQCCQRSDSAGWQHPPIEMPMEPPPAGPHP